MILLVTHSRSEVELGLVSWHRIFDYVLFKWMHISVLTNAFECLSHRKGSHTKLYFVNAVPAYGLFIVNTDSQLRVARSSTLHPQSSITTPLNQPPQP